MNIKSIRKGAKVFLLTPKYWVYGKFSLSKDSKKGRVGNDWFSISDISKIEKDRYNDINISLKGSKGLDLDLKRSR